MSVSSLMRPARLLSEGGRLQPPIDGFGFAVAAVATNNVDSEQQPIPGGACQ
jgi:hypothetical protein